MVTIRTAICHHCRLTIVAAQQDCKRPFSDALCADVGRSDHDSVDRPAIAYAPRSVLNLMLGGPRRGRHGLGPQRGWDDQKPEKTTRSRKVGKQRARSQTSNASFCQMEDAILCGPKGAASNNGPRWKSERDCMVKV